MFGYYRFILASLVFLSHLQIRFLGFDPGVMSVISFYILAGFVASKNLPRFIENGKKKIHLYYFDRILRIYPLFYFFLFASFLFVYITRFGNPVFTPGKIRAHLLIVPLNYFLYFDYSVIFDGIGRNLLIPPAWSLATELQAYILLPFAILFRPLKIFLSIGSMAIYIMACLGILKSPNFSYFLLPGVFFVFLTGVSIHKQNDPLTFSKFDWYYPVISYFTIFCLSIILWSLDLLKPVFLKETLAGFILGVPLIKVLSQKKIKLPLNKLMGDLSYAFFLCHMPVVWMVTYFLNLPAIQKPAWSIALIYLAGIIFSVAGVYLVDRPFQKDRGNLGLFGKSTR